MAKSRSKNNILVAAIAAAAAAVAKMLLVTASFNMCADNQKLLLDGMIANSDDKQASNIKYTTRFNVACIIWKGKNMCILLYVYVIQ